MPCLFRYSEKQESPVHTQYMKLIPTEEETLVARLKDNGTKDKAFRELMGLYKRPLYAMLRKLIVDHHDTDEALQLTFIKIYKYIDGFKGDSKLYTWIYTIARNEAYRVLKDRAARQNMRIDDLGAQAMQALRARSEYYAGDEIQYALQKAVNQLPLKQREVFNLKYFDGMKASITGSIRATSPVIAESCPTSAM